MSISVLGQSNSGRKYDFFKEEKTNIKLPFALRDPFLKKRTKNISNGKTKKTYGTSYK
mgnify:FL=1